MLVISETLPLRDTARQSHYPWYILWLPEISVDRHKTVNYLGAKAWCSSSKRLAEHMASESAEVYLI